MIIIPTSLPKSWLLRGESWQWLLQGSIWSISPDIPFQDLFVSSIPFKQPHFAVILPPPSKTLAKKLIFWHNQPHLGLSPGYPSPPFLQRPLQKFLFFGINQPHLWAYSSPPSKGLAKILFLAPHTIPPSKTPAKSCF